MRTGLVIGGVVMAVAGTIGFIIVKAVTTSQDSSAWSTAEVAIVGLLGLILLAIVIMAMLKGLGDAG